jgi:hypothetical protein
MTPKDYRPWERPRLVGRCASCGQRCTLTEHGLCDTCSGSTRDTTAWAPAFPSPVAGGEALPDSQTPSLPTVARPTESAGAGTFDEPPRRSRDTW